MSLSLITLTAIMFGTVLVLMAAGFPLAFCLGGVAVLLCLLLYGASSLSLFISIIQASMVSFIMVAIPGFIFMAMVLERSGIANDLYGMMHTWLGRLRGGLAMGTVVICAIFAAMCGISGAATVTMGLIALPAMLKRNYDSHLAVGCISAGGALGILIPPSVIFIVWGETVGISIGKLFMGGVFPGLLIAFLAICYIGIRGLLQPKYAPSVSPEERSSWREKFVSLRGVILPLILIVAVLGSIFTGVCTPSEAASIGAAGSLICAVIHRRLNLNLLREAGLRTIGLSAMVMWIVFGAKCFTAVYTGTGASHLVETTVLAFPVGRWGILILMQFTFFFLGMLLDPIGIIMITAPVYVPIAMALGFDPVWYGVLFVINMEMAYITPPFGFNLFYMKGIVPPEITMADIYRAVVPFIVIQATALIIVMMFPQIALWLPSVMVGT